MSTRKNTKPNLVALDHPMHAGVTTEVVKVTPDLAAEWLGKNHGNRNQRPAKIAQYVRDMLAGNWMVTGATISFDWNGRMIDGQHRCEAIIESGKTATIVVVRGLDPRAQDVIDQGARRSAADALRFNGVPGYATTIAAVAVIAREVDRGALSRWGDSYKAGLSNSEVVEWYAENRDIDHAAALASRIAKKLHGTPAPIAYAIWRLEQIDLEQAHNFFTDLAQTRTDGSGDPRAALLDAMRRIEDNDLRKPAGSQLSAIFRAWNAMRAGKSLKIISSTTSTAQGRVPALIPEPK